MHIAHSKYTWLNVMHFKGHRLFFFIIHYTTFIWCRLSQLSCRCATFHWKIHWQTYKTRILLTLSSSWRLELVMGKPIWFLLTTPSRCRCRHFLFLSIFIKIYSICGFQKTKKCHWKRIWMILRRGHARSTFTIWHQKYCTENAKMELKCTQF